MIALDYSANISPLSFAHKNGSVTGDKKAQKFDDDCLEDLFACLKDSIKTVAYMPTRNTPEQLSRLRQPGDDYGMLQISGEDITPRQSFVIKATENPISADLIDVIRKLIEHEKK